MTAIDRTIEDVQGFLEWREARATAYIDVSAEGYRKHLLSEKQAEVVPQVYLELQQLRESIAAFAGSPTFPFVYDRFGEVIEELFEALPPAVEYATIPAPPIHSAEQEIQ